MVPHQSRPSPCETAAMTNARLGRMEQAPSTNSDKASLHDREVSVVPALTEDAEESTRASMKKPLPEPMMQGKDRADVARTISHPAGPEREALSDLAGMGAADRAGKTIHSAQVKSTAQQSSTHKSHISRPTNSLTPQDTTAKLARQEPLDVQWPRRRLPQDRKPLVPRW